MMRGGFLGAFDLFNFSKRAISSRTIPSYLLPSISLIEPAQTSLTPYMCTLYSVNALIASLSISSSL